MNSFTKNPAKKESTLQIVKVAKEKTVTPALKVAAKSPVELKMPPPIDSCFKGRDNDCL
ncbi:hypothetical protein [Paraflavitalea sp. CAU 1676]|uniref:hypothetical protein n=1 Tax=Paraflavitalea sp. CAU 1676 TaxID=3032598 RepID=UPI0023DBB239|nr:hypothetical protein [Paraflavitalea sp. CAU 1676]MDF2187831.1 hypothetical protein [Paraflavitalea sp. CAU 1676]